MARASGPARARRLLAILHLLQPHEEVALATLADALGITTGEAAEDLSMLACCGLYPYTPDALVPLYLEDGVVTVFGELPALNRPVRLSAREAHALAAALELAGIPADAPLTEKLFSSAASLEVDAGELARLLAVADSAPVGELLGDLVMARDERRCVLLRYQGAGREETSDRIVEPLSLVNEKGSWYLEAYCRSAGALRTFKVDRIRECELCDYRFAPRDVSPTGRAFVTEGLPVALVRVDTAAEPIAAEWPGARIVGVDEGGSLVEVPYAGTDWLARQVVALLGQAEVIEPTEMRTAVRDLAQRELERAAS